VAGVVAVTVVAAIVRFVGIGHQSYWYDEAHTVWLLHYSLGGMFARLGGTETSPPLYFVLAWLWSHIFGYGEAGLRSLSAVAGVATVPVAYGVGRKLVSARTGMIAALLVASNPLLVWYSQEARSYALLVLLTAVALLAFAHLQAEVRAQWAAIWAMAAILALATHYYAALVIVPQGVWLFIHHRRDRAARFAVEGVVVGSSWLAVLAFIQLRFLDGSGWIIKVPLAVRAADVPKTFAIGPAAPLTTWLSIASAAVVGIAAWLLVRRASDRERGQVLQGAGLLASGMALVVALLVFGFDQLDYRNVIALWLPTAIVVAGCLSVRRAGYVGLAATGVLCAIGFGTVIDVAVDTRLQRPDWRAVARAVGSRPRRAIFAVNGCQLLPLSLSVPGLTFAPATGVRVSEIDVVTVASQTDWYQVLFTGSYVVCQPQKLRAPVVLHLKQFRATGGPVRIGPFSVERLRSRVPVVVTPRTFASAGLHGALMIQGPASSRPAAGYSF
jgi:hypothetical protein